MSERLKDVVILASGTGSTAGVVIRACQEGRLFLSPKAVISSKEGAGVIKLAEELGVPTEVVDPRDYRGNSVGFEEELMSMLGMYEPDVVAQLGWTPLTPLDVVKKYLMVNQHPGPLDPDRPDFGGKGMYGPRVMAAVLIYSWLIGEANPWTEATFHLVTPEYDRGEVIRRERMGGLPVWGEPVTIEDLAGKYRGRLIELTKWCQKKLLEVEHENVVAGLEMMVRGESGPGIREVPLIPRENWGILREAKKLGVDLFRRRRR